MTDEQVIKRKLLIDGDGTGDERRLHTLHKSLIKFCSSDTTEDEAPAALDKMLIQLSQCEFTVKKSRKVAEMNTIELENYKSLSQKITRDIEHEKIKIEKTKQDLQEAKRIRKNKMEYDALGKIINQQPNRKKSEEQLAKLQAELAALKSQRSEVVRRLTSRKQQFHGLTLMIHQLQATLAEDDIPSLVDPVDDGMEVDVMEPKPKGKSEEI